MSTPRTPVSAFKNGFSLEESRHFLFQWEPPVLLGGGDMGYRARQHDGRAEPWQLDRNDGHGHSRQPLECKNRAPDDHRAVPREGLQQGALGVGLTVGYMRTGITNYEMFDAQRTVTPTLIMKGGAIHGNALQDWEEGLEDEPTRVRPLLLNGWVMDPETMFDAVRNVGVKDGKIAVITKNKITGKETIEAKGPVVAPGFIDLMSQYWKEPKPTYQPAKGVCHEYNNPNKQVREVG